VCSDVLERCWPGRSLLAAAATLNIPLARAIIPFELSPRFRRRKPILGLKTFAASTLNVSTVYRRNHGDVTLRSDIRSDALATSPIRRSLALPAQRARHERRSDVNHIPARARSDDEDDEGDATEERCSRQRPQLSRATHSANISGDIPSRVNSFNLGR